jgi:D-alanyl-D-alanine carboxypeptidase (penicillin-binding protein 5/6)
VQQAADASAVGSPSPQQPVVPVVQQDATQQADAAPAGVYARAALLYDSGKKRTLWSKSADTRLAIGSMTKVMTALVVLKSGGSLNKTVTITNADVARTLSPVGGSTAYLRAGDKLTVRQLLYALMLPSGCDAASALARTYGGYSGFVKKMNAEARKLHLNNTHYANYDGLNYEINNKVRWTHAEGYSTARDQVTLGRAAMQYSTFRTVVGTAAYHLPASRGHHDYRWYTTNHLLGRYPGAIGIKTGHTDMAGYCLLFADQRRGRTLVGVLLNDGTPAEPEHRFGDARSMLDWAFKVRTSYSLDLAARGLPSD